MFRFYLKPHEQALAQSSRHLIERNKAVKNISYPIDSPSRCLKANKNSYRRRERDGTIPPTKSPQPSVIAEIFLNLKKQIFMKTPFITSQTTILPR